MQVPQIKPSLRLSWAVVAVSMLAMMAVAAQSSPGMPRAQRHESRHEIDQLEAKWQDAILHRNVVILDGLLADDYLAISATGTLQSKEQTLDNLRAGTTRFGSIEVTDRKVRFYGQTALVTSRAEVTGTSPDGKFSGAYRYTRVYVRDEQGKWKIVSFEASPIRGLEDRR